MQSKCLYNLRFGVRPQHSIKRALITIAKQITTSLDKNNFTCGVFLDFQKTFDTVNHKIFLSKLNYNGIKGISHKLFHSYLNNRKQYTNINDFNSSLLTLKHGLPQRSVLGPSLFLIYITDLNYVIKHSSMRHFADDTNLLYSHSSLKLINKQINLDLKLLVLWLRTNRISLNVDKITVFLF